MAQGSIFTNNRSQAVRLPAEMRFPKSIKKVTVRAVGKDRIISPTENTWDNSFFMSDQGAADDFMEERSSQVQAEKDF